MTQPMPSPIKSKREMGLFSVTSLVISNMIGSGIFILPATLAMFGSISLFGWIFTGIGSIILAFVFAKLSRIKPMVGGPYAYCREALGDFIGFQVAFCYWIAALVAIAGTVISGIAYLNVFFPAIANKNVALILSIAALWLITALNILGIRETKISVLITTALKVFPLLAICIFGLFYINFHNLTASFNITGKSNFSALASSAMITLWAFVGFETATVPTEYIKKPERTIPLGTMLGTMITTVLYVWGTLVVMGIVSNATLVKSATPFAIATKVIFGNWSIGILGIIVAISALSNCIGWVLMQGQIPMAVAQDGLFPKVFAKTNKKLIPINGLVISSILMTVFMLMTLSDKLIDQFNSLVEFSTILFLFVYVYSMIAALFIFIRHYQSRSERLRLFILCGIGLLAFLYALWTIIGAGEKMVFYGSFVLFGCGPIYIIIKKFNNYISDAKVLI